MLALIIFWLFPLSAGLLFLVITIQNVRHKNYFAKRGVPYLPPSLFRLVQFLTGKVPLAELERKLYNESLNIQGNSKVVGLSDSYVLPSYYIMDLDLTRNIYVKDFEHFVNRRQFGIGNNDVLFRKMLVFLENERWKGLREKLSPAFSSGKIRQMFPMFNASSDKMCSYMKNSLEATGGEIEMCDVFAKYALDVVASCAFGMDSDSFNSPGVKSTFERMSEKTRFQIKPMVFVKLMILLVAPKLATVLGIQVMDNEAQSYFLQTIKNEMKQRRESGKRRQDFLQLMMDLQDGRLKENEHTSPEMEVLKDSDDIGKKTWKYSGSFEEDDIVANCVLFLIGGFDTTQSLMIFAAYQLALEEEVQQRLFEEVKKSIVDNGGKLDFDSVMHLPYLDMFINETLRFFPPAVRTERRCMKDYKIPGTDVTIEKGTMLVLPVLSVHRDPRYFENPDKFDPERFLPERKITRHPYAFAPFGHGARSCIGMRFALAEVKTVIASLVYNFQLAPCKQTDIPIKFQNNASLKPLNGMWLHSKAREVVLSE